MYPLDTDVRHSTFLPILKSWKGSIGGPVFSYNYLIDCTIGIIICDPRRGNQA